MLSVYLVRKRGDRSPQSSQKYIVSVSMECIISLWFSGSLLIFFHFDLKEIGDSAKVQINPIQIARVAKNFFVC